MRSWRAEVDDLLDSGIPPGPTVSTSDDRARVDQFATVVGRFQNAALRPHWPVIRATAASHADALALLLATGGADAVLRNLHPWVTWDDPILTVRGERSVVCAATCPHWTFEISATFSEPVSLEGRGLALVPSVLATGVSVNKPCDTDDDGRSWYLTFPVPWDWGLPVDAHHHRALIDLLGATRATVLDALLGRTLTTSELARRISISRASASEHASVLRSAGLVTSSREGPRVYHSLTSMGIQLATGRGGVTFTGRVADRGPV